MPGRLASLFLAALALGGCGGTIEPSPSPATPASGQPTSTDDDRMAGWTADLRSLVTLRERHHPDPWHGIDRELYVRAVEAVVARIGQMNDDQLMVEATRLAAMPTWAGRDGHGGIYPWGEGSFETHLLPLRLYRFSDGWFVVDAMAPYEDLVGDRVTGIGDRVTGIGGHEIEAVLEAVEPLVARDNDQQVLSHGGLLMVTVEVLHGLGLLTDVEAPVPVDLDGAGRVAVEPVSMTSFGAWAGGHHVHSPPAREDGPAWLRNVDEDGWWEWQADTGTAFIQLNEVADRNGPLVEEVRERLSGGEVQRIVLDLRHNPGGDNTLYAGLLQLLDEGDAAGVPLYVIMGRATFSAAGNLLTDLEQETDAILVGEDSGNSPNQYGNSIPTELPHSGLVFRVAPQYVIAGDPDDTRVTIRPDLPAPLSSADYFGGRDPAIAAILADS
jgi:hypothetical protein